MSQSGQQALASVIINRIQSSDFPDSLTEVVYQKNAFSVTMDGALHEYETSESVKESCQKALYEDNSDGSLYFLNYNLAVDQGYKDNADLMVNYYETVMVLDGITFLR